MKKILLLSLILSPLLHFAQGEYRSGARFGIGQSEFTDLNASEGALHLHGGFVGTYQLLPWFALSAEALISKIGSRYEAVEPAGGGLFSSSEKFDGNLSFISFDIPVYPKFSFGSEDFRFTLHGGGSMNFNLLGFESRDYENPNREDTKSVKTDDMEVTSFNLIYGAGVEIKTRASEFVFLEFRVNNGLSSFYETVNTTDNTAVRANHFAITAGYVF